MSESYTWSTGLEEVAPGVYGYVQALGTTSIGNGGLVTGPDQAMVVDALATAPMALAFLRSVRSVTPLPIGHLVVTHHHTDHSQGIQFFLPTQVVCHEDCRKEMVLAGPHAIEGWAKRFPESAEAVAGMRVCLPTQTIDSRMTLYLGEREVQVFHPGPAHSRGDLLVYLPRDKVLFAGDVCFFKVAPAAKQGHLGKWIGVLARLLEMEIETVVPGHGPIGGRTELQEMHRCLVTLYEGARQGFERGLSEEDALAATELGAFGNWGNPERYAGCVAKAYQELRDERLESFL